MSKLKRLNLVVDDIDKLVIQILQKGVDFGKTIKADTDTVSSKTDCNDKSYISDLFREKIMAFIADAEIIRGESDAFLESLSQNNLDNADPKQFPFLLKIWQGDTYGSVGVEALEELKKDLKVQCDKISHKILLSSVMETIRNDTHPLESKT